MVSEVINKQHWILFQVDPISRNRGRRDSCTQITDGELDTMTIESNRVGCDNSSVTAAAAAVAAAAAGTTQPGNK